MEDLYRALFLHINHIRTMDEFKKSQIAFIPESNYAFECDHMLKYLNDCGISAIPVVEEENKTGLHIDYATKRKLSQILQYKIERNSVKYYANFFTITPKKTPEGMKEEMFQ